MTAGKLRVGIAGRRGMAFAPALRALPGVELTALCEKDSSELGRIGSEFEVEMLFGRFTDMLDAVDAVVVASPMQLHAVQTIAALEAGKHVMSEVTAAVSLDECWRIVDAVRSSGKTYMMAENYCYNRENVLVKELVRKGLFGELYFGEGEYIHDVRNMHRSADGTPTWRYYWQVGINGSTYPTHSLGPVMQWFAQLDPGERIVSVVCLGSGRHVAPEHPQEDTTLMLCKLASGKLIKVRLDMLSNRPHLLSYYAAQGTTGAYEACRDPSEPGRVWFGENKFESNRAWRPITDFDEHLPSEWRHPPDEIASAGHGGADYFVVRDFVLAIQSGSPPPIDVYASMEWTAAGLCSQLSIDNGGVPIKVPNFRDPAERPVVLDAPPVEV